MLALRRVSTIHQYIHPLSSYQYRFKSKQSTDDPSKQKSTRLTEELLNFDRKSSNPSQNTFKNKKYPSNDAKIDKKRSITQETLSSKDGGQQAKDRFRSAPVKRSNQQNASVNERNRSPSNDRVFDLGERKQKRDEQTEQKKKNVRPQVILDTESSEVQILTRQVADSLTPPNAPNESSNIEQELLDVLRGHRIVSKSARQTETQSELFDELPKEKPSRKRQPHTTSNANVDKTTEAFSSLLRDFELKSTRTTSKPSLETDFMRDAIDGAIVKPRFGDNREQKRDGSESRKMSRDVKRRQEYLRPHRLWSGEPLGIFSSKDFNDLSSKVSPLWEKYEQDELTRISSIPPRNAFEEMIQWTKDGILWKFPVDNEQDVGPEADVPFYDHVLLERHLHDFPNSPIIRQFMELVCIGLGRNPYWRAEQKLEHINWFRKFFNEKLHIFNETVHTGTIKTSAPASTTTKPAPTFKPKTPPAAPKVVPAAAATPAPTASKN